jgi:hypothetical protein
VTTYLPANLKPEPSVLCFILPILSSHACFSSTSTPSAPKLQFFLTQYPRRRSSRGILIPQSVLRPPEATNLLFPHLLVRGCSGTPITTRPCLSCQAEQNAAIMQSPSAHATIPTDIIRGLFEVLFFSWDLCIQYHSGLQDPFSFSRFVCHLTRVKDKTQIVLRRNYLVPRNGAVTEAEAKR